MSNKYKSDTIHSLGYYKGLILCISQGLVDGKTHRKIAEDLNDRGILTPTGRLFTIGIVANMLKEFRNPETYRTNAFVAMLRLAFDGELSRSQCLPLLTRRAGTL